MSIIILSKKQLHQQIGYYRTICLKKPEFASMLREVYDLTGYYDSKIILNHLRFSM